eukprot:SAG31_NODE_4713_length_3014_cov_13.907033_2_plen_161_part_00
MGFARCRFVDAAVAELEISAPEAVAKMLAQCKPAGFGLSADGTQALSLRSGTVYWDAATQPTGLTHAYRQYSEVHTSAAGYAINSADISYCAAHPCCAELPASIIECISADPTGSLAHQFRRYVRHSFLHEMRRVSSLLEAHAAVVELPPIDWCVALETL